MKESGFGGLGERVGRVAEVEVGQKRYCIMFVGHVTRWLPACQRVRGIVSSH